jgi:hypothetical protein
MSQKKVTRREFIEKAAYVAPVVITLAVNPSLAQAGSPPGGKGKGKK